MANLQDICHLITDGKHGDCQNEEGSGYYFISCKDVKDGWVDYSGARQITEADYQDTHKRTQLEPNDILITNSGTIGRMVLVPSKPKTYRTTFQKSVAIVKPNSSCVTPQWLYYCLKARKDVLIAWAGGTAQKNLLLRDLRAFKVEVPPLTVQNKIAFILSAYDDLIQNNTRRIKILEEIAQRIYREWFVDFRYPGHENDKLVDSELGMIPDGWEVVRLEDELEVTRGLSYAGRHLSSSGVPMHNLNSVLEGGGYKYSGIKFYSGPYKEKDQVVPGDVLVANTEQTWDRLLIAFAAIVPRYFGTEGIYSHHLYRVRPRPASYLSKAFIYLMLNENRLRDWISRFGNGTTINMLPRDALARPRIPRPPKSLVDKFTATVVPMLILTENLYEKSENLRQTRDLLLSKLISGQIDVSELDIETNRRDSNAT